MADNRYEEVLRFIIQQTGATELLELVRSIEQVGDASGESEKQVSALLEDLSATARAGQAVGQIRALGKEFLNLQQQARAAQADVRGLSAAERESAARTREAAQALEAGRATLKSYTDGTHTLIGTGEQVKKVIAEQRAEVARLGTAYKAAQADQKNNTRELERARAALSRITDAQNKLRAPLAKLSGDLRAAGASASNLAEAERAIADRSGGAIQSLRSLADNAQRLRREQELAAEAAKLDEQAKLRGVRASAAAAAALDGYRAKVKGATADTRALGAASQGTSGLLSRLAGVAAGLGAAFSVRGITNVVKDILGIGDAAERTRRALGELYGSQSQGNRVFEEVRKLARANGQEFEGLLDAARRLKAFGLEPLDGTLQGLVDLNARLGGSQERLEGIITAVSQAWAKQKLQQEEVNQLAERGVNAWDLLSKATGKSVAELQKLSSAGKLGRDEIKLLLDEIAKSAQGSAAKNLDTLSSKVLGLRDRIKQFFLQIAESGSLKFFKDQLDSVLAKIDQAASDGTLERWAKNISNGIVSISTAVRDGVAKIIAYKDQLLVLASAFAAVKVAQFAASILTLTSNLDRSIGSMLGYATAAKEGEARTKGLTSTVGGLGAALGNLGSFLRVNVIAVAVGLLVDQIAKLNSAIDDYSTALDLQEEQQIRLASTQAELARRIATAKELYAEFAAVGIRSSEELANASEAEARAYQRRLQGAITYFRALQAEAKIAGDAVGLAAAREKLSQLADAVELAKERVKAAREEINAQTSALADFALRAAENFDALRAKGEEVKQAVSGLFDGVDFSNASTALNQVADTLDAVGARGSVAAASIREELTDALSKVNQTDLTRFRREVETAFAQGGADAKRFSDIVGITVEASLRRLGVSANAAGVELTENGKQIIAAFENIATSATATSQQVRAAFVAAIDQAATQAEANQLGEALSRAFQAGKISAAEYAVLSDQVKAKLAELKAAAIEAGGGLESLGASAQKGAAQAAAALSEATAQAAQAGDATAAAVDQAGGAAAGFRAAIEGAISSFRAQSEAAAELFKEISRAEFAAFYGVQQFQTKLKRSIDEVQARIDDQKQQAAGLGSVFEEFAQVGVDSQGRVQGALDMTSDQLLTFADNVRNGRTELNLLGQQDLDRLAAAAERAAQRVAQIEENARSARERLADLNAELADEIDRAAGNEEAIAKRRFEQRLAEIKELARQGGAAAQEQARQAEERLRRTHELELQQIRDRQAEEERADEARSQREQQRTRTGNTNAATTTQQGQGGQGNNGGLVATAPTINVTIDRPTLLGKLGDKEAMELARTVRNAFQILDTLRR